MPALQAITPDWGSVVEMKELYPEMTIAPIAEDDPLAPIATAPTNMPVVGDTAKIVWNGVDYTCTGVMYSEDGTTNMGVMFGNAGAMIPGAATTDEPFLFVVIAPELVADFGAYAICVILDGSTTVTFSANIGSATYHRIPSEYVGTYDQPKWGEEKDAVVLPETEVTSTQFDITTQFTLEIGKTYYVYWNGTKYNVTGRCIGGSIAVGNVDKCMSTGDTGEPFLIITNHDTSDGVFGIVRIIDGSSPATVSIMEDVMHEIPGGYIEKTWFNEQITNVEQNARSYTDSSLGEIELKLHPNSWDLSGEGTPDFIELGFSSIDFANAPIDVVVENPNEDQWAEYEAILFDFGNHVGVPIIISYKYNGTAYNAIANAVLVNAGNPFSIVKENDYRKCLKMNFFIDPSGKTNSISDTLYLAQISLGSTTNAIEFHVRVRPMMFGNT